MKISLLAVFVFLITSGINAQKIRLNYGAAAGLNMATMTTPGPKFLEAKPGFSGYVFVDIPVFHHFSLQNEIGYYNLGAITKNEKTGVNWKNYTTTAEYLALSILGKFTVKNTGLSFLAGYAFARALSTGTTGGGPINDTEEGHGTAFMTDLKQYDIFGVVGIEYYLKAGPGISVRYMNGLLNVLDLQPGYGGFVQNHAFVFTVAYRIFR